jgi:hypothetical protein
MDTSNLLQQHNSFQIVTVSEIGASFSNEVKLNNKIWCLYAVM